MAPEEHTENTEHGWPSYHRVVLKGLKISEQNDEKLDKRLTDVEKIVIKLAVQVGLLWAMFIGTASKVVHDWVEKGGP